MASQHSSKAKDFFLHLLSIAMLYFGVITFILLLFRYVDVLIPDVLGIERTYLLDSIRWSIASLIVVYPVYAFTLWLIDRDLRADPSKADVWIRKWLTYLTLFLAAIAIISDLVTLIYNFLNGDLTLSFTIKIVIILIVVGTVFGYYFWDLRRTSFKATAGSKAFAWGVSAAVILAIVVSFFLVGSPSYQRQVRLDQNRVDDLQYIQNVILNYWTQKSKIPAKLDDLRSDINSTGIPVDPITKMPYEYIVRGKLIFALCATFDTESIDNGKNLQTAPAPYRGAPSPETWSHGIGRVCFERTIDPELNRAVPQIKVP